MHSAVKKNLRTCTNELLGHLEFFTEYVQLLVTGTESGICRYWPLQYPPGPPHLVWILSSGVGKLFSAREHYCWPAPKRRLIPSMLSAMDSWKTPRQPACWHSHANKVWNWVWKQRVLDRPWKLSYFWKTRDDAMASEPVPDYVQDRLAYRPAFHSSCESDDWNRCEISSLKIIAAVFTQFIVPAFCAGAHF